MSALGPAAAQSPPPSGKEQSARHFGCHRWLTEGDKADLFAHKTATQAAVGHPDE